MSPLSTECPTMTIDLFLPDTVAPELVGNSAHSAAPLRRASHGNPPNQATQTARPGRRGSQAAPLTPHQQIGFQLGCDHAHHAVAPPAPHALEASPVHQGWLSGQAVFGQRTLAATEAVHQWLALRLHAWQQRRHVELLHITPAYLQRLAVTHCPVTRERLNAAEQPHTTAVFDGVRSDAAFAAGNVAVLSARAQHAKAAHRFADAAHIARTLEAERARGSSLSTALGADGLTAAQWGRVAVLCSFVEPLPHAQACTLPLLVLPPNRLRLLNPVQALQTFISRQLLAPGWSARVNALEALLVGAPARRAFRLFFQTWLPRFIEAGGRSADVQHARWALEDAWQHAAVMQRWERFALLLNSAQCESLVLRAVAAGLAPHGLRVEPLANACATDGWCLDSGGHTPDLPPQPLPAQLVARLSPRSTPLPDERLQRAAPDRTLH
jgi:hypothetical protein